MSRVGFIGTGHIAAPMARAVARDGHEVSVSDRNARIAAELAAQSPRITVLGNQAVVDQSDILFLCLRPDVAPVVLPGLEFRAGQQIVSVMAGVSRADLLRDCAPADAISQTIPIGFMEHGGCPLAAYPDGTVLEALFGQRNTVIPVASEAALNQHFAACTLIPGMLDMMATASGWLSERTGDARKAELFVTRLLGGYLAALGDVQAGRLTTERDALATPGTISRMMIEGLERGDMRQMLTDALNRINTRLEGMA